MAPNTMTSPLLGYRIPLKIRQKICRYAFQGSKMWFDPIHRPNLQVPVRRGQSSPFSTTGHWHLLMVCRQVYREARIIFIEQTVMIIGDAFLYRFHDAISNFTKAHVQHLRNVKLTQEPGYEAFNILCQYPNLKTCSVSSFWEKCTDLTLWEGLTADNFKPIFDKRLGMKPDICLRESMGPFSSTKITFFFKHTLGLCRAAAIPGGTTADCDHANEIKVLYVNMTTRKHALLAGPDHDDEDGFLKTLCSCCTK